MALKVYVPGKDDEILQTDPAWPVELALHKTLGGEPCEGYISRLDLQQRSFRFIHPALFHLQISCYKQADFEIHKIYDHCQAIRKKSNLRRTKFNLLATGTGGKGKEPLITMPLSLFNLLVRSYAENQGRDTI